MPGGVRGKLGKCGANPFLLQTKRAAQSSGGDSLCFSVGAVFIERVRNVTKNSRLGRANAHTATLGHNNRPLATAPVAFRSYQE